MFRNILLAAAAATSFSASAYAEEGAILGHTLFGSGPEKVIVFHDWMGDAANYDPVKPWLDPTAFTYAFVDVRGYGLSKTISGVYTTDEIAADTLRLAEFLGWSRFHLVGHSMNGQAGFKTILVDWQGDRRIKSYVAVTPVTPDAYPATAEDEAFLTAAITDDEIARQAFGALVGGKLNSAWASEKTNRNRLTSRPDALRGYYEMWINEDFSEALKKAGVDTPVLVIGGRNDLPGFQEDHYAKTVALWLPAVSFEFIDNAGHYPMQETPVLFATLLERHLNAHR